jgi:1-acyl-sn-glycerol-3-phosphate acyltransferase
VESAKQSVERARQVIDSGLHITSFVEGTRSRDGRLLPFKKGPFYLAMETGNPIVPISIWGTESMMKKGSVRITPGTAHVVFHAPVWPRDYATREELMAAVRQAIASSLPAWMRGDDLVLSNDRSA